MPGTVSLLWKKLTKNNLINFIIASQLGFNAEKMQKFLDTMGSRATDEQLINAVKAKDAAKVKDLISSDMQDLIQHKIFTPAEAMQAGAKMLDLVDKNIDAVVLIIQSNDFHCF